MTNYRKPSLTDLGEPAADDHDLATDDHARNHAQSAPEPSDGASDAVHDEHASPLREPEFAAEPESAAEPEPAAGPEHAADAMPSADGEAAEPPAAHNEQDHAHQQRQRATQRIHAVREELRKVLIGQDAAIDDVLTAWLAGGHVLIEGVPGLGKTLLVRALARCFAGEFNRIQFTPELTPADITGQITYDGPSEPFTLRKGPVFTHLLLADEINRAPARTQAALLEAMQERQVTLNGVSVAITAPFMVVATQNPIEHEGTYALPEAQLDRFMFKLRLDYPAAEQELALVRLVTRSPRADLLEVQPPRQVLTVKDVAILQRITSEIPLPETLLDYAVRLVRASRAWPGLILGASPRATIALVRAARARAVLRGGEAVLADDIHSCALAVLRHRVRLTVAMAIDGMDVDQLLSELIAHVPAPRA